MKKNRILSLILVPGIILPAILSANIPTSIHYQGKVTVDGEPFDGTGEFKFAIVDDGEGELEQATAEAKVDNGFVTNIEVLNPGFGYSEPPAVSIIDSERSGSGAAATAFVEDGQVVEIEVDDAGSNYTNAIVRISAPSPYFQIFWSHDGTAEPNEEPSGAISLPVHNGVFSVALGGEGMEPIEAGTLPSVPAYLRVWFDSGSGFQQLTPDQPLHAVPYAHKLVAGSAVVGDRPDADNIADDGFPAVFTAINSRDADDNPGFGIIAQSSSAGLYVDNLRGDGNFGESESPEHNPDIILGGRYLSGPGQTDIDNQHAGVIATEPSEAFSGMFLRSNYRLELFKSYSNANWSLPELRVYHGPRDNDNLQLRLDNDGNLSIEGVYSSGGADFAERIAAEDPQVDYEVGDVLVISAEQDRAVALSTEPNSTRVIGVYSANPGFIGGTGTAGEQVRREREALERAGIDPDDEAEVASAGVTQFSLNGEKIDVAIAGIVPVKVTDENGPIGRGDLLTTASTPGHAMRSNNPQIGTIVGKAMGELYEGSGLIKMFVMAQ